MRPNKAARAAAAQATRQIEAERAADRAIRDAGSYGALEKLAGVTDRVAFWAPFVTDEAAARDELRRRAKANLVSRFLADAAWADAYDADRFMHPESADVAAAIRAEAAIAA